MDDQTIRSASNSQIKETNNQTHSIEPVNLVKNPDISTKPVSPLLEKILQQKLNNPKNPDRLMNDAMGDLYGKLTKNNKVSSTKKNELPSSPALAVKPNISLSEPPAIKTPPMLSNNRKNRNNINEILEKDNPGQKAKTSFTDKIAKQRETSNHNQGRG